MAPGTGDRRSRLWAVLLLAGLLSPGASPADEAGREQGWRELQGDVRALKAMIQPGFGAPPERLRNSAPARRAVSQPVAPGRKAETYVSVVEPVAAPNDTRAAGPASVSAVAGPVSQPAPDAATRVAELAARVEQLEAAQKAQDELASTSRDEVPKLHVTSWLDLDFTWDDRKGSFGTFDNEHAYFIFSGQVNPEWKAYAEVEFERGAELSEFGGTGDILIEQAWADYRRSQYLSFRLGKLLTPAGIWNRNHWDPITETSTSPFLFKNGMVPINQTGVSASGSVVRGRYETNYAAYVVNGRGKTEHWSDDNGNKGVGLDLSTGPDRRWRLGLSAYSDKDGTDLDRRENLGIFYGNWEHGPWHAQFEWLRQGGAHSRDSFYLQPSYRLDKNWKLVMRYDTWNPDRDSSLATRQVELLAGVNRRFADSVLGKLEFVRHEDDSAGGMDYNRVASSLSILF